MRKQTEGAGAFRPLKTANRNHPAFRPGDNTANVSTLAHSAPIPSLSFQTKSSGNNIFDAQVRLARQCDMHIARQIVAGAGALMGSALITLLSMTQTQWVKEHPTSAQRLGFALLVGAIICFVFWITTRERPRSESKNEGNFAGHDNKGVQINKSIIGDDAIEKILKATSTNPKTPSRLYIQSAEFISIDDPKRFKIVTECLRQMINDDQLVLEVQPHNFVAGGINYVLQDPHPFHKKKLCVVYSFDKGPLQAVAAMEEATLRLPQPLPSTSLPKKPLPVLDLAFASGDLEISDYMVAFINSDGEKCHSIRVHNKRAAEGEAAHRADSLSAGLTFKFAGSSRTVYVDRACWIGKVESEIYLHPGDTEHVLIGIPKKDEWIIYENPNKYDSGGWPSHHQFLKEVKFQLFENAQVIGEINVIAHQNNMATTLATRRFVISVGASAQFRIIRWQNEA